MRCPLSQLSRIDFAGVENVNKFRHIFVCFLSISICLIFNNLSLYRFWAKESGGLG